MVVVTLDHVLEVSGAGGFMTSATDPSLCHGGGFLNVGSFFWPTGRVKTRILRATCLRRGDLLKPFADARYHKHQPFAQDLAKL